MSQTVDTLDLLLEPETTCDLCFAEFLYPEDLTQHINQVHKETYTKQQCQFCTHTLPDLETYALHIRDEHLKNFICCKYCNRVFDDFDKCRKHESKHYTHNRQSKYTCSNCYLRFTNILELEQHERKDHADSNDGVLLYELYPLLSTLINIKALSFLKSIGEEIVYVCVVCEFQTADVHGYIDHLKIKDCRSFACDRCSSVYKNKKGLNRHYSLHKECHYSMKGQLKRCGECMKLYDEKTLKEHLKHCKAIKCNHCNIVFDSIYDLSEHQSLMHPSTVHIKACKFCNKGFAGLTALDKHVERAHRHEFHLYKYVCVYCKSIFKHPKNLFAHFYSTHKDLEPYTCKICDKKFKIRKRFTIHIKLDHRSIGYTEFDENYHVFFSEQKSDNPFMPPALEHGFGNTGVETGQDKKNSSSKNKVRFDVEETSRSDIKLDNINSDIMSATETEGNQTEVEIEKSKTLKRKHIDRSKLNRTRKRSKYQEEFIITDSSDEDEPLLQVKKRAKRLKTERLRNATWNKRKDKTLKGTKNAFTCNICNKNCYTYQNYNNHLSLHKRNVATKCVKCSEVFKSKEELNDHYTNEHSTSLLTKTLKNLLEKRKNKTKKPKKSDPSTDDIQSNSEKFKMTIKKVSIPESSVQATVKPVANKSLSVQKFIENFKPEAEPAKKEIIIDSNLCIKYIKSYPKEPVIKMNKCNLKHTDFSQTHLSLPVRFTPSEEEQYSATIKLVQVPDTDEYQGAEIYEEGDSYYEEQEIQEQVIPDVAQEVMLEVSEEAPKTFYIPHKVVIPKLNVECKKIRIAHLQPQAPFYKIVKVEEALNGPKKKEEAIKPKQNIKLPDGTKLVSVNPLAHLLGDTSVEKILKNTKNKHYQPKNKDFETAIAKAMLKLKNNDAPPKRKKKVESKTSNCPMEQS